MAGPSLSTKVTHWVKLRETIIQVALGHWATSSDELIFSGSLGLYALLS